MAKKKSKGYVAKPFCYYCERDFEDEKVLMQHQKAKHFKCRQCPRKLNTAGGLAVHVTQVHKTEPEKLENCIKGRDGYDVEIFGMEGVPADVVKEYHRRKVEETGIAPTEVKPPAAKRPKFSNKPISEVELHAQLAAHKALMSGVAPIPPPMTPVHGFPPPPGLGGAGSPFPPGGFPGGPPGGMPGMPPFMPPPGASGAPPPPGAPVGFRPPFPPMPPGWQPGMPLPPFPPNNAFAPPPPAPGLYGPTPTLSSPAGAGAVGGTARSPMPPGGSPAPPGGQAPPFGFAPLPPGGFAPGQVPPPPPFGMPAPGAAGFSPHGAPGVPPPPPAPTAAAPASGSGGMVYSLTDLSPEERRAKHPRYAFQPAGLGPKQGAPPTATSLAADEPVTMADASETVVEGGEATGTKTTSSEEELLGKGRKRAAAADLF